MPPFCGNNTLQQILNLISAKLTVLAAKEVDLSPVLEAIAAIPETDLTAVLSALATIDGNTSGLATIINGVQTSVNSANSSLGTITTNTGLANSKLDTLQDDVTIIKTNANTINTNVNTANGTLNNHTTKLTTIDTKIDTLQAAIDALDMGGGGETVIAAIIWDEKAAGVNGGTFTAGAWRQRELNTRLDPNNLVIVASNAVTVLAGGMYLIKARVPFTGVNYTTARLMKNGVQIALSQVGLMGVLASVAHNELSFVGELAANDVLTLEHRCSVSYATYGFGAGAENTWAVNIYSVMEVYQI